MSDKPIEPNLFVFFGGTGDLARRKLMPSLARLQARGLLGEHSYVLALSRKEDFDDASFRRFAHDEMLKAGVSEAACSSLCESRLFFQCINNSSHEDFATLKARIEEIEQAHDLPQNRAYYLALPPTVFEHTIEGLGRAGLNHSKGWTRIVVEKPFGHDLASAQSLNAQIHAQFDESQVYRIDHYLGKDTVQNFLVFRFANPIFEQLWNRNSIESVEIAVGESLGTGGRAGYYDKSGALRDMIQNHLTQLFSLIAMEVPSVYEPDAVRHEKIKVLRSTLAPTPEDVIYGQYASGAIDGEKVIGYLDEDGIAPGSATETFVALKLRVDNWRWQGVPFYLRTGKRMPQKTSRVVIKFKGAPISLFQSMGEVGVARNVMVLKLQPDEGFDLYFDVKTPGSPFDIQRRPLHFSYKESFDEIPEAYETLLLDVLEGDQTLFVHAEEVEASWKLYSDLIENPPKPKPYFSGSWGPEAADFLGVDEAQKLFRS
ncbi:MAG: glucose-6-phosphate dehydrogenase [Pseudomonadota bacterium]